MNELWTSIGVSDIHTWPSMRKTGMSMSSRFVGERIHDVAQPRLFGWQFRFDVHIGGPRLRLVLC
jgi:hypothetical protein